jgi:hypothetical protein
MPAARCAFTECIREESAVVLRSLSILCSGIVDELEVEWPEHCPTKEVEVEIDEIGAELLILWESEMNHAGEALKPTKHKSRPNKSALMSEERGEEPGLRWAKLR